jgi:hypothetical protein
MLGLCCCVPKRVSDCKPEKSLGAKAYDIEPGPVAVTMPDREVNVFTREVDVMQRCGYPQINVRVSLYKLLEPMHEPFRGKVG